ncbi:transcriptional regulator [Chitinophaga caeni]|uniref:Transcriptional regulator n=1 Tax=Chitinophaga caeni TaxID=2029983 RepID=A0A291QT95_9BACT|nr:Crp/Fnr family transcriptional regulator [Chitinophaga caeni]ATL47190.1 transcriptional regulator [Chitinophaga caeni]
MKKEKKTCDQATCTLCRLCLREWQPALRASKQNFSLKKGELLFQENEPVNGIYFIYKGKMKVHKKWGDKELIVRFAREGDIVGHRGVGKTMVYPISATALEPVTVCYFDIEFFLASLKVNQAFLFELMMFYARELQESEKHMRNIAHMPVKGRLAYALLNLKEKFGIDATGFMSLPLSKQDIAAYIGATYETVFRMMNELVIEQAIELKGKQFTILDEDHLLQLIQE